MRMTGLARVPGHAHLIQNLLGLAHGQRGGRLVEDQAARSIVDRPSNGDRLSLAARQCRGRVVHGASHVDAQGSERLFGDPPRLCGVEPPKRVKRLRGLVPQDHVARDRQQVAHRQVPGRRWRCRAGGRGAGRAGRSSCRRSPRSRWRADALRQDLDQRALAGPVVAEESQDFASVDLQRDVVKGDDRLETPGDVAEGHHRDVGGRRRHGSSSFPLDEARSLSPSFASRATRTLLISTAASSTIPTKNLDPVPLEADEEQPAAHAGIQECAEDAPHDTPVAPGEQRAADHRDGNGIELPSHPAVGVDGEVLDGHDDPGQAEVKPEMLNSRTVVRRTGTPRFRAAAGFWPMAKTQFPVRVPCRKKVATTAARRNHRTDIRKPPSTGPERSSA